jgi:hypothetical protein
VDLATDPDNCGSCGHGCQGGKCTGGACQPITLASLQTQAFSVTAGAGAVYWGAQNGEDGLVMRCAAGGCGDQPTVLVVEPGGSPPPLTFHAGSLFWSQDDAPSTSPQGSIVTCAAGGCAGQPATVVSGLYHPGVVALDAANVYWTTLGTETDAATDWTNGAVLTCPIGGCNGPPTTLASGLVNVLRIAVDAENVYFTTQGTSPKQTDGAVWKCAIGGCNGQPTTLASGQTSAFDLVVAGGDVYWTTSTTVMKCATAGCGDHPTVLASGLDNVLQIAADAEDVYFTVGGGPGNQNNLTNGSVMKCARSGCDGKPTTLASGQLSINGIAVDDTSVYWANGGAWQTHYMDGAILKVAK